MCYPPHRNQINQDPMVLNIDDHMGKVKMTAAKNGFKVAANTLNGPPVYDLFYLIFLSHYRFTLQFESNVVKDVTPQIKNIYFICVI